MPIIYETTARIAEDGRLNIEIDKLPFEKGTEFLVKLIPKKPFDPSGFKDAMRKLMNQLAKNNPYKEMSKDEIIAELRRQREEMFDEPDQN